MSTVGLGWSICYPFGFFIMAHSNFTIFDLPQKDSDEGTEMVLEEMAINLSMLHIRHRSMQGT
jgi:hypothetical protein